MKYFSIRHSAAGLAFLLTLGLIGCEEQLDIQPLQSVEAATALDTPEKVEGAIIGAYGRLDLGATYGTNFLLLPDLLGTDIGYIAWQGTFQSYREIVGRSIPTINTEAERTWNQAYQTINLANIVLEATSILTDKDQKSLIEGEAHMMRGMLYFDLARLYAQPHQTPQNTADGVPTPLSTPGLPINLSPNKTEEQASKRLARTTLAETYQQILTDVKAAEELLPDPNDGTDSRRFDKYDAKALLARIYLQMGNYAQALAYANDVIEGSGATLNSSIVSTFTNKKTAEVLFEVQQNDQNNAGNSNDGLATFYSSNAKGFGGRGDVRVLESFANKYEDGDQRGVSSQIGVGLLYVGDGRRAGRIRSYKWNEAGQNIPLIRLSEMYLIRAEANARLGSTVGASPLEDINTLRSRAKASLLSSVTIEDILEERDLELAFEGFRLHDIKRVGRDVVTRDTIFIASSAELVLPIPQYEINLGNALPQNQGY